MGASIIDSRSRLPTAGKRPDFCSTRLIEHRPGRAALGLAQSVGQRAGETCLLVGPQEGGNRQPAAARDQEKPFDAEFLVHDAVKLHPERVERPFAHAAAMIDLAHRELGGGDRHLLVGARTAIIGAERDIDEQYVEPEETEHRPGAEQEEHHAADEAQAADAEHEDDKAGRAQRAVRRDEGRKDFGIGRSVVGRSVVTAVVAGHGAHYTGKMARKKTTKPSPNKPSPQAARKGKVVRVKTGKARSKADVKAAHGQLPQWTTAEIAEAFRRFAAANPAPRGELQHSNPFTLLVAVVLSAQATDAGVNKATPALFALADTPEQMARLGEERITEMIRTIGLFRTKAKNVVALSQMLLDAHSGAVPRQRDALEALPGVGRKTANVVLN